VVLEPDDLWDLVHERDTQPLVMVRPEGEPVVDEAEPQPDRGVPTVRARNERVVDVVQRRLHFDSPVGCNEFTIVRDFDAVVLAHAQREKQCSPSLVELVREALRCHDFKFWRGMAATLKSIFAIRDTHQ